MTEIEANWTISLCAAEETNYILCRLDSRPPLTYQTTNNQLIIYIYIEHKLVNKKIVFSKILPHFKDEKGINSLHSNVVQQCGKTLRCVCVSPIYIPSITDRRKWNNLRTLEITWHSDRLTRDFLDPQMTTMTFGKRWDQLSMTSIKFFASFCESHRSQMILSSGQRRNRGNITHSCLLRKTNKFSVVLLLI